MIRALRFSILLPLCVGFAALWCAPAAAALHVCNRTSYVLYTATGFQANSNIVTSGWTRVAPGDCAAPLPLPLAATNYFLYARTSRAHSGPSRAWGGPVRLCAKDTNFALQAPIGTLSCDSVDAFLMPFAPLATRGMKDWTTTLTESPRLATLDAARDAGIERLLNDAGYQGNLGDGRSTKARDDALAKFRARMKISATASADDLIDALETEALKATAPAGYSICNDGESEIWAALALRFANDWVSRGWWKVVPGACAKALTAPLANDKVYLYVAGHGNNHLVTGPTKFCTTDVEFEVFGRDRCAAQGLSEMGFAATDTKGRQGYAAHVGKDGLVPPAPSLTQVRTPK